MGLEIYLDPIRNPRHAANRLIVAWTHSGRRSTAAKSIARATAKAKTESISVSVGVSESVAVAVAVSAPSDYTPPLPEIRLATAHNDDYT